jgi:conjugative transposon TraM protein
MNPVNNNHVKKRKALLFLPLLLLPFITLAFWALGGGKAATGSTPVHRLNLELPKAQLKDDKAGTKLSAYEAADRDSLALEKQAQGDRLAFPADSFLHELAHPSGLNAERVQAHEPTVAESEQKVYAKLSELKSRMNSSGPRLDDRRYSGPKNRPPYSPEAVAAFDRASDAAEAQSLGVDPELRQLNQVMDKVLAVQHPERVKTPDREATEIVAKKRYLAQAQKTPATVSLLLPGATDTTGPEASGFYGLTSSLTDTPANAFAAVVPEAQTLFSGGVIKLRLASDILLGQHLIPSGTYIYGKVSLGGERLQVTVSSILYEGSLYAVQLDGYDLDGLPGISMPGALSRDVAKNSLDHTTQLLEFSTLTPSVGAQAASAGLGALKNWASRKAKQVNVHVPAGYRVLLYDHSLMH